MEIDLFSKQIKIHFNKKLLKIYMANFYHPDFSEKKIRLSREESQHISKTLRGKIGDRISLLNGHGEIAEAEISFVSKNRGHVECEILNYDKINEPDKKIHLYLSSPRHNILSGLIKQCVELGVWEIHFINCEFSVSKPKDKADSLLKDMIAGAKQSGNTYFPKIHPLKSFNHALEACSHKKVLGAVQSDNFANFEDNETQIALWIGPEGGFSDTEKRHLRKAEAQSICVGQHILRVETAVVGLVSILNH